MTSEMIILHCIVVGMVLLFLSGRLSPDLVALLGLTILTLAGFLTPAEASSGFSSSPVITLICIFFLSTALSETGVADFLGKFILKVGKGHEAASVFLVMLCTGIFSSVMNNVAAVAIMLPVVIQIARTSSVSASRLLIPISYASMLGGMITLIGTPPNMIASDILAAQKLEPFHFFDFTPFGVMALIAGSAFMALVGRHLLPKNPLTGRTGVGLTDLYRLQERLMYLRVPTNSVLDGLTLGRLELGSALGARVVGIIRRGDKRLVPGPNDVIKSDDVLMVEGRLSDLEELKKFSSIQVGTFDAQREQFSLQAPLSGAVIKFRVAPPEEWGNILDFSLRAHVAVFRLIRGTKAIAPLSDELALMAGDELSVFGEDAALQALERIESVEMLRCATPMSKIAPSDFFAVVAAPKSKLPGLTLKESRIEEIFGVNVLAIERAGVLSLNPEEKEIIQDSDVLLIAGESQRLEKMALISTLEVVSAQGGGSQYESPDVAIVEVILAPRSTLIGKTIREVGFRSTYGFQVLAIWRDGAPRRAHLGNFPLKLGDALLLQGSRRRMASLARNSDFVVLSESADTPKRTNRAIFAIGAFAVLIFLTAFKIEPVQISALVAALMVVLSGAVSMDEVHRKIEWRIILMLAALMPLGIAAEKTGAAIQLAQMALVHISAVHPHMLLAAVCILASIISQALESSLAVILLSPVVLRMASDLHMSPYPFMMAITLGASIAFLNPLSARSNMLVMGAGGYRQLDYFWGGALLSVILIIMFVLTIPIYWPFF